MQNLKNRRIKTMLLLDEFDRKEKLAVYCLLFLAVVAACLVHGVL